MIELINESTNERTNRRANDQTNEWLNKAISKYTKLGQESCKGANKDPITGLDLLHASVKVIMKSTWQE